MEGVTGSQIAFGIVLDNPMITSAAFGTTTMSHLEKNAKVTGMDMPQGLLEKVRSVSYV